MPNSGDLNWKEHSSIDIEAKRVKGYVWDPDALQWVKQRANVDLPSTNVISQSSIVTIAGSAQTTIVTYTNTGSILYFDGFVGTGTVDGEYELSIDTVPKIYLRSSEMNRNIQLFLPVPLKIAINSILTLKVIHYDTFTADFDGSLFGHRY